MKTKYKTKELLIELRDQIRDKTELSYVGFKIGLCNEITCLSITDEDHHILFRYINTHRPRKGKHFDPLYKNDAYYWKIGLVEPRLAWLNDTIKNYREK